MLILKGGIIKIYKFTNSNSNNPQDIEIKEIIKIEEEEYNFNYGIELKNGNLAFCSEDSTIKIIKINYNQIDNNQEDNDNNNIDNKYAIIQKIDLGNEPMYIIKEFIKGELILGCWQYILIFLKVPKINKYELMNKVLIKDKTFSLIELSKGVIISSQCYSKKLTIFNMNNYKFNIINNIESNENPNIICKYNKRNDIVIVAYNKGINIVSITNKCIIKNFEIKAKVTSLCPFITHLNNKNTEIFSLLCGIKSKVFNQNVNYNYNFIQIGFNIDDKNGEKIEIVIFEEKSKVHFNEINSIENLFFSNNKIINMNRDEQLIISIGSEDKRLILWEDNHKKENKNNLKI